MLSTLYPQAKLTLGPRCGLSGTVIAAAQEISLGADVMCGANVTITDTDWHAIDPLNRRGPGATAPVFIEDGVWLGLNVTVLKGVRIGAHSVIAAGSIVTHDIPESVVAGGVPAKVIRQIQATAPGTAAASPARATGQEP